MDLDAKSVFFSTTAMMLANGAILGLIRSDLPEPIRKSANTWWVGTMLLVFGTVLFVFPQVTGAPWGLPLANGLIMLGPACYAFALRQFYDLPPRYRVFVPVAFGVLGIYWFLAVWPNISVRILVITLVWMITAISCVEVLWGQRKQDDSASRKVLLGIYCFIVGLSIFRAVYYLNGHLSPNWKSSDNSSIVNALTPLLSGVLPIIGTTAYLLMCSERLRRQWEQAASTDYLTGLPNRLTLVRAGMRRFVDAARLASPFAVAVLDVDHFKVVNDRYGHEVGDVALKHMARLLRAACRAHELPARQGGEEFVLMFEYQEAEGALAAAERLRASIEAMELHTHGFDIRLTASMGVAVLSPLDASFDAMLRRADAALYKAKAQGRNQVVLAES